MPLRLVETTPPDAEPLTLAEAKLHLRVTISADDELIADLIAMSRQVCESFTGLALVTRSYSLFLDSWPEEGVVLPRPPLSAVTQVNVYDADGAATVFNAGSYIADTAGFPARIMLREGVAPPSPGRVLTGIEIQYTAGFGTAEDVPPALKTGMKQYIARLYDQRGGTAGDDLTLSGAAALFQPFRVMSLS